MDVDSDPNVVVVNLEHCVSSDGGHLGKSSCIYTTVPTNSCHDMLQLATPVQCLNGINQSLSRSYQHQHLAQLQYPQVQVSYDNGSAGGLQQSGPILPPPSSIYQGSTLHYPPPPSFLAPLPPQPLHILESTLPLEPSNSQISVAVETSQAPAEGSKYPADDYEYYREIENYLLREEVPGRASEIYLKNLKSRAKHYLIVDNVLYHNQKKPRRVVMLKEEQLHLLHKAHLVEKTGIHQGIKKMLEVLREKHFWRGMYVGIANYVKKCAQCRDTVALERNEDSFKKRQFSRQNGSSNAQIVSTKTQTVPLVWNEVEISIHGPFKRTTGRNESIVTITDPSSCFIVGAPISHHGLCTKVTQFILHTFYTFGFPTSKATVPSYLYEAINSELTWHLKRKNTNVMLTPKMNDEDNRGSWVSQLVDILVKRYPTKWDKELDKFLYQFRIGGVKQLGWKCQTAPFYAMFQRKHSSQGWEDKENVKSSKAVSKKADGHLWQCTTCVQSFTSKNSYRHHVKLHQKKPPLKDVDALHKLNSDLNGVALSPSNEKDSFTAPEDCIELTVNAVKAVLDETKDERRKRGKYQKYSAEIQQNMASYAAKYGSVKAAEHFTKCLGRTVSDSTIRNIVKVHTQFFPSLKEEIAKHAIDCGIEKTVAYFSERLRKKVSIRVVKNFKNWYLRSRNVTCKTTNDEFKSECNEIIDVSQSSTHLPHCQAAPCFSIPNSVESQSTPDLYQNTIVNQSSFGSTPMISHDRQDCDKVVGQHFLLVNPDESQTNVLNDNLESVKGSPRWPSDNQPFQGNSQILLDRKSTSKSNASSTDIASSSPVTPLPSLKVKRKQTKDSKGKKRGSYATYSPELRAEIGKYAAENGSLKASNHFTEMLGHDLAESTARTLKGKYLQKIKHSDVTSLGYSPRGRPLRLGKYDEIVQDCLRELFRSGEKVTSFLAITTAKQILNKFEPELLSENGGSVILNSSWAKSFLKRIGVRNNS